jgi:hypothetical protein
VSGDETTGWVQGGPCGETLRPAWRECAEQVLIEPQCRSVGDRVVSVGAILP